MAPIVIDRKQDSNVEDDSTLEFPVLQPSFEVKDMKHYVDRQENKDISLAVSENNSSDENNDIARSVSENNGSQENSHSVEANIGNINIAETSSKKDRSLKTSSSKKRMQERAKLNDIGGIIIPTVSDFSAAVSLKEWLHDEGDLHSAAETTIPRFGDTGSKLNVWGSCGQPSNDKAELETYSFPVLSIDGESRISVGSGDSAVENKRWDHAPFDPELPASLDKDLEQLSQRSHIYSDN